MEIRVASLRDKDEIVSMYERSQLVTGLPDPQYVPANELGDRLYSRHAIERYVAIDESQIVGHGLIELANPIHEDAWRRVLGDDTSRLIEMGGAFVEPKLGRLGIWSALLLHRITIIRELGGVPVSATWVENEHVKSRFTKYGGLSAGRQTTPKGEVDLYVFPLQ